MSKIKITCDSTCDLTDALYEQYGVEVIPLGITLGENTYHDGADVTTTDVFEYVARTGELPKTSAISVGEYVDVFEKYVREGYEIVHINLSSELSSCYRNACLAAEDFTGVYPIDSRNLSSGSGHLVLEAARLANEGKSGAEIADILNEIKGKLDVSFVLQTLEYLRKGGRCSSIAALGANMLHLRPEIEVRDGKMQVARKYRGTIQKSVTDYIRGRLEGREDIDTKRIFVTHSHAPREVVDEAIALVQSLHPFTEVIETIAGCTITSHCGKECLGVLFFTK